MERKNRVVRHCAQRAQNIGMTDGNMKHDVALSFSQRGCSTLVRKNFITIDETKANTVPMRDAFTLLRLMGCARKWLCPLQHIQFMRMECQGQVMNGGGGGGGGGGVQERVLDRTVTHWIGCDWIVLDWCRGEWGACNGVTWSGVLNVI